MCSSKNLEGLFLVGRYAHKKFGCPLESDLVWCLRASLLERFFVLSDSKLEGWEKIENVSSESHRQLFEETGKTQDPV